MTTEPTPEELRVFIAEACGYYPMPSGDKWTKNPNGIGPSSPLPDYPNSLDAMHAAEKVLTDDQRRKLAWVLLQELDGWKTWKLKDYEMLNVWEMSLSDIADCLGATALQRATAFCLVFDLK